ncbi:EGF-containing fibulin-like extracellular matrix protein 1 [Orbicella faveolata]|uniref:EGF-containing fibulin-like extracellular matrix protein 1 n=1 Tax=Orbicella faveolata TaxID=48498 RepID=UPI0009E40321|nr:EGF-containing fibulin-like extracellular matrix protein 1 [Orbicella faveolata]
MLNRDRKSCQDVDECTVGSHFCDDICHNTLGSFTCHCKSGYRLMADLKTCLDVDECTEPGHGCSQLCNNTMGGYNCYCLRGYWLKKDNKTCADHHVMLDSSKPTTLSAGMVAFVAIASVSVLIVIGTVVCVIRYRRSARLRDSDMLEGEKKSLFSWME